jgi:oxaloacetate decarboxylase gamma subunit
MSQGILDQGIDLMLFGMGTVFVFLTVLVFATVIMSGFIQRYLPEKVEPQQPVTPVPAGVTDPKVLAIIKAAIDQHRNRP